MARVVIPRKTPISITFLAPMILHKNAKNVDSSADAASPPLG